MLGQVPLLPLEIGICRCCGHVYQRMHFGPETLADIYEKVYAAYHSPFAGGVGSGLAQDFLRFLERHADLPGVRVLEIGCYDGYLLSLLREAHGCLVMGCDPSPGGAIAESAGIPVRHAYFSPSLFTDRYRLIIMRGLLEHIPGPVAFLADACHVLGDGGTLAIEVPSLIYSLENGVIGDFFHEHISYFTSCLRAAGLTVTASDWEGPYLRVTARRSAGGNPDAIPCTGPEEVILLRSLFGTYQHLIRRMADELRDLIADAGDKRIYLYGGGGHTIGLLARVHGFLRPKGVIDGDPAKEGKFIPGFDIPVCSKRILSSLDAGRDIVIVSSKIFQGEILRELRPLMKKGLPVITLYEGVQYAGSRDHA